MVDELNRLESLQTKFPPTAQMRAYHAQPFSQGFPDLPTLRAMPSGTLGHTLAVHMDALGVDFSEFDRKADPTEALDHTDRHIYETHDIWHALTGFGVGPANEIGLQAFTLAQIEGVPSLTLVSLSLLRVMLGGAEGLGAIMDAISVGWQRGRDAKRIFGVDWRPHLARPIAEVRRDFGVVAIDPDQLAEVPELMAA
jgi:ubiquinone biosynthesis protein Coq4